MWLACANAIALAFLSTGGVGLYQEAYQMPQFFLEGNTEQDADDEEIGGSVEMQIEPEQEEVVEQPETPEVVEEIPQPEPEPEVVETVAPENAIFPVPEKQEMIEPLKLEEVKPKPKPKPQPKPAPRPRPVATGPATTGPPGGGGGAGQGLRTGGAGSKGKFPQPPYPSWAKARGITGSVTLSVTHDATGTITRVRILATCGDSQLDSYTSAFIQRRWRFPAGVAQTHNQQVIYKLRTAR